VPDERNSGLRRDEGQEGCINHGRDTQGELYFHKRLHGAIEDPLTGGIKRGKVGGSLKTGLDYRQANLTNCEQKYQKINYLGFNEQAH